MGNLDIVWREYIQDLIRKDFDNSKTTWQKCKIIIKLSKKCDLDSDFINELINDYEFIKDSK